MQVCREESEPTRRTVSLLQDRLLEAGLFVRRGGLSIRDRLPPGALHKESPTSDRYHEALRDVLRALAVLQTASDGAALILSPWKEAR